jgi:hypothetical protein
VLVCGSDRVACAQSAAAELGAGIRVVALLSLCRTAGNKPFNSFSLICVCYKGAIYRIHF